VDELPYAQSTVSEHLRVLKEAGLVRGEINPPRVCYCVEPAVLEQLVHLVGSLCSTVPAVEDDSGGDGCSRPTCGDTA